MTTPAPPKSLDAKLARIRDDSSCRDFILADAKDADMGLGIRAPGPNPPDSQTRFRSLAEYRQLMRDVVRQGLVDIVLMSPSSAEILAIDEQIFEGSAVTPAARANDATDIWLGQSGNYARQPSRPFRSATLEQIQRGSNRSADRSTAIDLGLYSITLNNDAVLDRESLQAYAQFRGEAAQAGLRHFLEVFAPNAPVHPIADVPRFVNDSIARLLAGVPRHARPLFLKMPYFGRAALEDLRDYDSSLVVGILGGAAGTTHDAFRLVEQAKKHGARAALFGRKINHAEDQLAFIRWLRRVADDQVTPDDATRAYHADLLKAGRRPSRTLTEDLLISDPFLR